MKRLLVILLAVGALALAVTSGSGCKGKKGGLGDTVTTASGLKYVDLKIGTGAAPVAGQTCTVHFTGTLTDGKKFQSTRDNNDPFKFQLGGGRVIKGWEEGVATMKIGGRRVLIIPPTLAWGDRGAGNMIPPNATTIFDVELLSVQ